MLALVASAKIADGHPLDVILANGGDGPLPSILVGQKPRLRAGGVGLVKDGSQQRRGRRCEIASDRDDAVAFPSELDPAPCLRLLLPRKDSIGVETIAHDDREIGDKLHAILPRVIDETTLGNIQVLRSCHSPDIAERTNDNRRCLGADLARRDRRGNSGESRS